MDLTIVMCWAVIGAALGAAIGQTKGRPAGGAILGLILGPIGWILIGVGPVTHQRRRDDEADCRPENAGLVEVRDGGAEDSR